MTRALPCLVLLGVLALTGCASTSDFIDARYLPQAQTREQAYSLGEREANERHPRKVRPIQTGVGFASSLLLGPLGFGGNYFLQVSGAKRMTQQFEVNEGTDMTEAQRTLAEQYTRGWNDRYKRNRLSEARRSALIGGGAGLATFFVVAAIVGAGGE
jgi:hypothetical protein